MAHTTTASRTSATEGLANLGGELRTMLKCGSTGCSSLGHPYYTCAAAATRNMVQAMTGSNYSEATFTSWEKISRSRGLLGIKHIKSTLNNHFGSYGTWHERAPSSKNNYFAGIVTDTYSYHQPVIQNVRTYYLPYFHHVGLDHYNVVFGWNSSEGHVKVAEEWNPYWTFGYLPSKYTDNPYGRHHVKAKPAYDAVHHSPNGKYVL